MMPLLLNPYRHAVAGGGGGGGDAVDDLSAMSYAAFDLDAEGFADSTAIGTLTDQSGNGRHATQATAADKPTADTVGGVAVATFDGSGDRLATAGWTAITGVTTVVALTKRVATTSGNYLWDGIDATDRRIYWINGSNLNAWAGGYVSAGAANTNWVVTVVRYKPGGLNTKIWRNGGTISGQGDCGTNGLAGLTIGSRYSGTSTLDGHINYLSLYNGDLYVDDLAALNAAGSALAARASTTWTTIT